MVENSNFPCEIEYQDTGERVVVNNPNEITSGRTFKVIKTHVLPPSNLNGMLFTLTEEGVLYINHVHADQVAEFLDSKNIKYVRETNIHYVTFTPIADVENFKRMRDAKWKS